jgi:UDP-glucose 4-epimerase
MPIQNKILVTGYKGYIGRNLIKYFKSKKIKFRKINLTNLSNRNLKNYSHLIHLKFFIQNKKKYTNKNIKDLKKVLIYCKKNNLNLIFPSTSSFKYVNKKRINNSINPYNYYALAKKKCEDIIQQFNKKEKLNYNILRIFNVYGGDINNKYYISKLISLFNESKKFSKIEIKYCKNIRDFINIEDLFTLITKVIKKKINGTFEVGSGKSISIRSLAKKINKISQKKINLIFSKPQKSRLNSFSKSHIKKTVKYFNWKPKININSGLRKLIS